MREPSRDAQAEDASWMTGLTREPASASDHSRLSAADIASELTGLPDGAERTVSRYGWHTQTRTVLTFDGDPDPDMTKVVPARIAAAMYASDLTSDDTIGGHGDTGAYGYSNQPWGGWTLENDPTVHGEVISPILSDTLDSWRSLRMACRHITDHGGGASAETGSHVTVSAGDFVDSPDKVNRLIGVLRHYQRELYLMGDAGHGRESRENQG